MTSLVDLKFYNNSLSGSIPSILGYVANFSNLSWINMASNKLIVP